MIYANMSQLMDYSFFDKKVLECFQYAKEHNLIEYEKGCHEINGEEFFVNIVEYETTSADNRFWEAHRNYLDVHVMLLGEEQIDLNFIENMKQDEFVEADDFLPLFGEKQGFVTMRTGDFLICYPHDAHRTAVAVVKPEKIKKAIFKVKI